MWWRGNPLWGRLLSVCVGEMREDTDCGYIGVPHSADYGLMQEDNLYANPDFFAAILYEPLSPLLVRVQGLLTLSVWCRSFTRLMSDQVLSVSTQPSVQPSSSTFRM